MTTDDKIDIRIYFDSSARTKKIRDFSINYRARLDGKWEGVLRVDTESHGDTKLEGTAHCHHFYKKKKAYIQPLGNNLDEIFESWLKNILKRSKHIKNNFLYANK